MAEQKKRGFHALEQRIHEMEEQDRAGERRSPPEQTEAAKREATQQEGQAPSKK